MDADDRFMQRALRLAERGWGQVAPNPLVGAVIVSGDGVVGEAYHARYGEEHAEVLALRQAGPRAAGATLYVNLEPCVHVGKTAACAEAIRAAGIREVVVACRDPNPVAAGGLEELTAAGVSVHVGTGAEEARRLNAPFFWRFTQNLPYVALKLATSLDGRIAARPGIRTPITGEEAAEEVHRLRAGYDAILVGRGTVEADDPLLTARGSVSPRVPPVRVVLDAGLKLSPSSRLVSTIAEAPVWVVGVRAADAKRRRQLEGAGVRVLEAEPADGTVDIRSALQVLREAGIGTLVAEGGSRVASSLLRARLVHRLYLLVAPVLLGDEGLAAFGGLPESAPGEWETASRRGLGRDTLLVFENRHALARLAGNGV
jgi:diaminohydroxyphosphoribosylaminopyrimidine deaminase/5-amino-6-(5-phosphoribosylamino)uracil reductase